MDMSPIYRIVEITASGICCGIVTGVAILLIKELCNIFKISSR